MNIYAIANMRVPNVSLKVLVRLAKTFATLVPEQASPAILDAIKKLAGMVVEVERALIARVREANPELLATEVEFDRATDTQWLFLRRVLCGSGQRRSESETQRQQQ